MTKRFVLASLPFMLATEAFAQDAAVYTYDALGRLTQASEPQVANPPVVTQFAYDAAGNRVRLEIAGAQPGTSSVVVLPMLNYLVIPLP